MKSSGSISKIRGLFIFLVTLSLALGACNTSTHVPLSDSTITISVDNGTRETLQILHNDAFIGKISQYAEVSWEADGTLPQYTITAKDMDGNIVYSTSFTREDISGKRTYRVIIPPTAKGVEQSDNETGK